VKAVKIIVLGLLTVVFIAYSLAFMAYRGLNATLLDQQYYHSVIGDYNLPDTLHTELENMISAIARDGVTGGKTITNPAEKAAADSQVMLITNAITSALDEQWIEEQTVMITDDVVNFLTGKQGSLSVAINLKQKLGQIESNIAAELEKFSDAELLAMFKAPRAYIPVISTQIVDQLGLPESVVIADIINDSAPGTFELIIGYLTTAKLLFGLLVIVVILVFLLICVLFWKVGGGFQWFGISTLLAGTLFLIGTSYFSKLARMESLVGFDFESLPIATSVSQSIMSFTFSEMYVMPIIFLVSGIILFIFGLIIKNARKKS
jgi:hypothetical protein